MEYFNEFTEYTGKEFNKIVNENNLILVKVLNYDEYHFNFQYKEGLNIDTNEFNPNGECNKGGLYFTDYRYLLYFYEIYGKIIRLIEIPNDARVYIEDNKYKADKIILNEKITIEEFYENYVNNKEICMKAVKKYGYALKYVPENLKDYDICLKAVKEDGLALKYVPKNIINKEICLAAVKNNGLALDYVPKNIINKEICLEAVKKNGEALKYVPENIIDKDICLEAVKEFGEALKYVHSI
jgi:hypothetical protein